MSSIVIVVLIYLVTNLWIICIDLVTCKNICVDKTILYAFFENSANAEKARTVYTLCILQLTEMLYIINIMMLCSPTMLCKKSFNLRIAKLV
jgi:hypothetical protein